MPGSSITAASSPSGSAWSPTSMPVVTRRARGGSTDRGDLYLRKLLVHDVRSIMFRLKGKTHRKSLSAAAVGERRGFNKATVALVAKQARILWVLVAREVKSLAYA
jgi:hypothetical protein